VHHGIIENFATLKAELESEGRIFLSDTDSETVAHLVDSTLIRAKHRVMPLSRPSSGLKVLMPLPSSFRVMTVCSSAHATVRLSL